MPVSGQDNQIKVAQSVAWGNRTKSNSPLSISVEENILISNMCFYCNIFKYTSLFKVKEFPHIFYHHLGNTFKKRG